LCAVTGATALDAVRHDDRPAHLRRKAALVHDAAVAQTRQRGLHAAEPQARERGRHGHAVQRREVAVDGLRVDDLVQRRDQCAASRAQCAERRRPGP